MKSKTSKKKNSVEIRFELNREGAALIGKVEEVFLFDDDNIRLLMLDIMTESQKRVVNLYSFGTKTSPMCAQVSFYVMPNGKVCACAYPCSVKVNYDRFNASMRKLFKHAKDAMYSGEPYGFMLHCVKNGYKRRAEIDNN